MMLQTSSFLCFTFTEKYHGLLLSLYIEYHNESWSVERVDWKGSRGVMQQYDRPVYIYQGGNPAINDADGLFLIYSGSRWFGVYQPGGLVLKSEAFGHILEGAISNDHGESISSRKYS